MNKRGVDIGAWSWRGSGILAAAHIFLSRSRSMVDVSISRGVWVRAFPPNITELKCQFCWCSSKSKQHVPDPKRDARCDWFSGTLAFFCFTSRFSAVSLSTHLIDRWTTQHPLTKVTTLLVLLTLADRWSCADKSTLRGIFHLQGKSSNIFAREAVIPLDEDSFPRPPTLL